MDRFMDEAESVLSSRSASPYSQIHVGNSSPAEIQTEKPLSSSNHKIAPSKSTYQNTVGNRPIATSETKSNLSSTTFSRVNDEPNISVTQVQRVDQQGGLPPASQSYAPTTFESIPAAAHSIKSTDMNYLGGNTTPYSAPNLSASNVAVYHIPSHLATAMSTGSIHANDGVCVADVHPLAAGSNHLTNSWSSTSSMSLLDADLFNNAKHGVFSANPNAVNQRAVSFAGGGYAAGSIGQSLE